MAFTFPELRLELEALGYGGVPDHVVVSSLAQLNLSATSSRTAEADVQKAARASRKGNSGVMEGKTLFPCDLAFLPPRRKALSMRKGFNPARFTPSFADESDEMKKTLKLMEGTREELFGKLSKAAGTKRRMGLADEHEQYVGSLMEQWRVVARTLLLKENANPRIGDDPQSEGAGAVHGGKQGAQDSCPAAALENSEIRNQELEEEECSVQMGSMRIGEDTGNTTTIVPDEMNATSRLLTGFNPRAGEDPATERSCGCLSDGKDVSTMRRTDLKIEENSSFTEPEAICSTVFSSEDSMASHSDQEDVVLPSHQDDFARSPSMGSHSSQEYVLPSHLDDFARSPSMTSYSSQGDVLPSHQDDLHSFQEHLLPSHQDDFARSSAMTSHSYQEDLLPSHQDDFAGSPSPPSTPRPLLNALGNGEVCTVRSSPVVAPLDHHYHHHHHHLAPVNPQDTNSQKKPGTVEGRNPPSQQDTKFLHQESSSESENPGVLGAPAFRTPDRTGGGGQSPLNDRSNIRLGERNSSLAQQGEGKATVFNKITDLKSPASSKRNPAVTLKRSRSSRDAPDSERAANSDAPHLSGDFAWERLNSSCHAAKTKTPPTGRRIKSEKAFQLSQSDASPKITLRSGGAGDISDLDISSRSLSSPTILPEPASPLKLSSNSKRRCSNQGNPASGTPEQRSCTCTVCPLSSRKIGGDSIRSPFGKSVDSSPREFEGSPKEKLSAKKEVGASPKSLQRIPLRKVCKPSSGIFTPLLDQKNNNVNPKVLLRTTQVTTTPMEFSSESLRSADRRAPSLRSSAESSRSSGQHRAPSSQSSKSNASAVSSPFAKHSSFASSYGSQSSASKAASASLTPGGPRRGGKVDRVARFAEMQNLWKNDQFLKTSSKRKPQSFHRIFARLHVSHERYTAAYRERVLEGMRPKSEPEPFVVPPLYHTHHPRVKVSGAYY